MTAYIELKSGTIIETDQPEIWPEGNRLSRAEGKRRLLAESLEALRELFPPGATVWTKVTHVSRSGMSRNIQAFAIQDNEPRNVSGHVARAIGHTERHDAVVMGGCGMDMGFAMVYSLSHALWPEYDCLGEKCPSADHRNRQTTNKHKDGYALRQRWI